MSRRADCIANTTRTADGTMISGHRYKSLLAMFDRDTDRWYYIIQCSHCQHCDVAFSDDPDAESELYEEIVYVGGKDSLL